MKEMSQKETQERMRKWERQSAKDKHETVLSLTNLIYDHGMSQEKDIFEFNNKPDELVVDYDGCLVDNDGDAETDME